MRLSEVKSLFRELTEEYFSSATVIFGRQSRQPKAGLPLISITTGNVKRPSAPNYETIGGTIVGNYMSRLSVTIDLFTHGSALVDVETGDVYAYENTALEDMLSFADFLNSHHTVQWCRKHDISILIDGDAQDLTGIVNDTSYEYRARLMVFVYFTQKAIDSAAIASEASIVYPSLPEKDEGGAEEVVPEEPTLSMPDEASPWPEDDEPWSEETDSASDVWLPPEKVVEPVIVKKYEPSPSGGGNPTLAQEEVGYFTEVTITKGEKSNE